eukprot:COSAG04_NODE_1613_length_6165_cov_3.524069_8_plen_285_part_00
MQRYLAASQTVDFCSASGEGRLGCDLGAQKLVVLPETTLPSAEGAAEGLGKTLVDYALGGGSVVVAGGALLFDADGAARGSFASPLGSALGLDWSRTHPASSLKLASVNVSRTANPEWWRLLTVDATMLGTTSPLQAVAPAGPDTLTLATVTLRGGGAALPLLTAKRMGQRGWLVYAASSEAALIEAAVDFILAVRTPSQHRFAPARYRFTWGSWVSWGVLLTTHRQSGVLLLAARRRRVSSSTRARGRSRPTHPSLSPQAPPAAASSTAPAPLAGRRAASTAA